MREGVPALVARRGEEACGVRRRGGSGAWRVGSEAASCARARGASGALPSCRVSAA